MDKLMPHNRLPNRRSKEVYELIRKQDIMSKIDLQEQSSMTGSTLTRTLEEMTAQGVLVEAGLGESTGGRKPILYRTNPRYAYVFGVEISRITSKLILCDLHMNKLETKRWMMTEVMTPHMLVTELVSSMASMMSEHAIETSAILGIGIGAVGPLDFSAGTILSPLYFPAPGWSNVPIAQLLESRLNIPVFLDNGANTAIIGEYWADRHRDYRHLLYVHLGVGLRSSMTANGQVVYGAVDMEGSIGQMIIQTDGPRLNASGNYGSLESFASIHALEQAAVSRLKQGRESVLRRIPGAPEKITFADLTAALKMNDSLTVELFTQSAAYFGIGLANLLNILHPEKVILGGPLVNAHPLFFQVSTKVAIQNTYYYPAYQVVFSQGRLGEEALVTGAAVMVINKLTE